MNEALRCQIRDYPDHLPLEQAQTIPTSWYFDPDLADLENQVIFGQSWQLAGRLEQVKQPGSFLKATIGQESLIVVRDEVGTLRGFYNVCRHRASPLVTEACGQISRLRCRYHGWTYDLTGRLRGVPEFEAVENFSREKEGLIEIAVAVWGLFVFVNLQENPGPLHDFLAPLSARTAEKDWMRFQFVEQRVYDLDCNWKVFVDNYLDGGYHVNTVHPGLAGILDYSEYHSVLHSECSVQISPIQNPKTDAAREVASVRNGEASYWWLFPNLMINHYDNCMDTNLVLPLGPQASRVIFDYYVAGNSTTIAEATQQSIAVGHQIQLEDIEICENVQRGLHSRSFRTGRFSVRREGPGYHFHQLFAQRLKSSLSTENI